MQIQIRHSGKLRDLVAQHPAYAALENVAIPATNNRCWSRENGTGTSHDTQAIFIGKTGYGKSSTVNALFNREIMGTSAVAACTRHAQCLEFKIRDGNYLTFTDLPGIGESRQRDAEYIPLYTRIVETADAIVYMMRADTRDYSIDELAYLALFPKLASRRNLIIGLNFCDKVEPVSRESFTPTQAQLTNIKEKIAWINEKFDPGGGVVPFSANSGWNIDVFAGKIGQVLVNSLAA